MDARFVKVLAALVQHTEGLEMDKLGEFWFAHEPSEELEKAQALLEELRNGST